MGIRVSGIIIEGYPKNNNHVYDCKELIFQYKKLENLSPKEISIAFINNQTVIFYDSFLEKILTEELEFSEFEKQVLEIFPKATLTSFIVDDVISFAGFSFSTDDRKIRVKATIENEIFIDKGMLISTEANIYESFIEEFKKNVNSYNSFKIKTEKLNEIQFQKSIMLLRDKLYQKNDIENEFNYTNGTLDNVVIENLVSYFLNRTFFEIEDEIFFYQLKNKKFNLLEDFKCFLQKSFEIHSNNDFR